MKLTILERLLVVNLLEGEGDHVYLKARRDFASKVGLSADEIVEYDLRENPAGGVQWRDDLPQESEFNITDGEFIMVAKALMELNDAKPPKLKTDQLSLYEKFVERK